MDERDDAALRHRWPGQPKRDMTHGMAFGDAGETDATANGGFFLTSDLATAALEDHTFTDTSIRAESRDGSVTDVRAGATDISFEYEGLEEEPEEATVELRVEHGGIVETIDTASTAVYGTSQSGVSLDDDLEGSVLDHSELSASDFEASDAGSTTETDVTLRLRVSVNEASSTSAATLNVVVHNTGTDTADGENTDEGTSDDATEADTIADINALIEDVNAGLEIVDPIEPIDELRATTGDELRAEIFGRTVIDINVRSQVAFGGELVGSVSTPGEARGTADALEVEYGSAVQFAIDGLNDAADCVEAIQGIVASEADA